MYLLKIKFTENTPQNVKDYYYNFKYHHQGDSGIDLYNPSEITIPSFEVGTINFQIQCEMRDKEDNLVSYYLYPRSSISKTTLMMANSVGIIDAGYRGNIMAKVRNMVPDIISRVNVGDLLFQICAPDLKPIKIEIVENLTSTSRGEGGFGSTNK